MANLSKILIPNPNPRLIQLQYCRNSAHMKQLGRLFQDFPKYSPFHSEHIMTTTPNPSPLSETECILLLLSISGARISEILSLHGSDIVDEATVIIRGKKRSASRMIRAPELSRLFSFARQFPSLPIFHRSYISVYRDCLARGIFTRHFNSKHRSVTHSLRYNKISQLGAVTENVKTVADCIGHRTEKTTQKYLSKGVSHG